MDFSGFLGNDEVKKTLSAAFASRRFPHAIVLQGEPGCGKRTLAALIAKALVCRDKEHAPCGKCPSCVRTAAGSHPDIHLVEGSGQTRSLTVDLIKDVISGAYRRPGEADYGVFILLLGDRTAPLAQNKLLKVIEEPPAGAVFLLVCRSAEQLLPTIRSRVQCFTLRPPSEEEAAAWLTEHRDTQPDLAKRLAALCGGNLGRMQEELKGGEAGAAMETAVKIADALISSEDKLLMAAVPLQKDRALCREVFSRLALIFRDACVLQAGGDALLGGAPQQAEKLSRLPMKRLISLPGMVEEFREKLDRNANLNLLVTGFCADLRQTIGK